MFRHMGSRVSLAMLCVVALIVFAVPAASGQGGAAPVKVELTPYEGNPVIPKGESGEWDSGFTTSAMAIYHDGLFHMFYVGGKLPYTVAVPRAIGYATSEDGLTWTKYEGNPLEGLGAIPKLAKNGYVWVVPFVDNDGTWVLYLVPWRSRWREFEGGVLRATAPEPTGPWTVDPEPVLEGGGSDEWDVLGVAPVSVTYTDDEYVLYYLSAQFIGRATSPDGIHWTKYDDPATTEARFANSDPVFKPSETPGWEFMLASAAIHLGGHGWEMFYTGWSSQTHTEHIYGGIGYAASEDGITWTRYSENPLFEGLFEGNFEFYPDSFVVVDDTYYLYQSIFSPTSLTDAYIGVSTGTVSWE
jgi:hypothetical protein